MPRSLLLCLLWFFFLAGSVNALDPTRRISQYGHSVWRLQDGMLPGIPAAITQTKDGYIWVGTQSGLVRFDGVQFVPWTPPSGRQLPNSSADIVSLLGARDGSLWIGTNAGLSHWSNAELINYPGAGARINSILEDRNGTIWVARSRIRNWSGPLCRVAGSDLRCYGKADGIPSTAAESIIEDRLGYLWIGSNGALIRWKERLAGVYPPQGATYSDDTYMINGVVMAQDNALLAGIASSGPGRGLQQFAQDRWRPFVKPGLNGSTLEVTTMFLDGEQSIWVGTVNQGIYRIRGEVADHFGRADGLSGDFVQSIFQDREGDIWIATSDGLDVFHDLRIANFTVREGLTSGNASSVSVRRDGSVWSGNRGGIDFLPTGHTSFGSIREKLPGRQVRAVMEDHAGNLWLAVDHGIYVYSRGLFKPVLNPIRATDKTRGAISFAEDSNGNIWAVLAGINPAVVRIHDFQVREEIPASTIPAAFSVVPDAHGGIWTILLNSGLAHYQEGAWHRIALDQMNPGLAGHNLFNIFVDSAGTVWGAGGGGLAEYRDGQVKLVTERNGLPCNFTYSLTFDSHSALWVFSQCGLTRISSTELQRFWDHPESKIRAEHFDRLDGALPGTTSFHPGVARSSDGRLWFSNGAGLQMIDPDHFVTNSDLPPVHIEQLVADKKNYPLLNKPDLPALTRDIEIDYTALSFVMPQRVYFRYILEGRDTTWQDPGTRRQAFYSDLHPGSYKFRVIACNNDGVWNKEGATLDFSIAPAWFQTIWFWIFCAGVFLFLLWLLYQLRLKQLEAQFNITMEARVGERTRIARELHDTLLQSLHGLMFRFQAARNMFPRRPEEAMEALDGAIVKTEQAIAESRNAIQDLRSEPVAEIDLAQSLTAMVEDLSPRNENGDSPAFRVIVEGERRTLSPVLQNEVCRLAHELLRNAFQHALARQVEAEILYHDHLFRLRIRDDGKGIDPAVMEQGGRAGHWGLPGMRERAQRIGAQMDIWSSAGAGTEVQLTVSAATAYKTSERRTGFSLFHRTRSHEHRS